MARYTFARTCQLYIGVFYCTDIYILDLFIARTFTYWHFLLHGLYILGKSLRMDNYILGKSFRTDSYILGYSIARTLLYIGHFYCTDIYILGKSLRTDNVRAKV